jgi:hypothetical protein
MKRNRKRNSREIESKDEAGESLVQVEMNEQAVGVIPAPHPLSNRQRI